MGTVQYPDLKKSIGLRDIVHSAFKHKALSRPAWIFLLEIYNNNCPLCFTSQIFLKLNCLKPENQTLQ